MAIRRSVHPAQYLALAIGAVYTVVGVLGYFVTGFLVGSRPAGLCCSALRSFRCTTSCTSSSALLAW
jgi:hypothetical protein